MSSLKDYIYLICPLVTLMVCQLIKFSIESIKEHELKWDRLFNGSGGMPSSHTSFSSSITMLIGWTLGFDSPLFAMSFVFMGIVCYDAMGHRLESEKQAAAINILVNELFKNSPKVVIKQLKEQIGHEPLEVLVGFILGTVMSFGFYYFMWL